MRIGHCDDSAPTSLADCSHRRASSATPTRRVRPIAPSWSKASTARLMRGANAKRNNWSTGSRRTRSADDSRSRRNAGSPRCGLRRSSRCWRADAPTRRLDRLLTEAERPEVLWQASATLGEVRFGERRFVRGRDGVRSRHRDHEERDAHADRAVEIRDRRPGRSRRAGAPARRECCRRGDGRLRAHRARSARRQARRHLLAIGARHRAARDPGADHVRIRQDDVHQCRRGGRARAAQRHQGAAAGAGSCWSDTPMCAARPRPT